MGDIFEDCFYDRKTVHGIAGEIIPKNRGRDVDIPGSVDRKSADAKESSSLYNILSNKLKGEKDKRKKLKTRKKKTNPETKVVKRKINWNKIKQKKTLFNPDEAEREWMIKTLDDKTNRRARIDLERRMTDEFVNTYVQYRNEIRECNGIKLPFAIPKEERKYATRAANWCIRKGVTPIRVLTYWHKHIGNFADSDMKVPPLHFLSGAANIETVACAAEESDEKVGVAKGHSYADTSILIPGLRKKLSKAGYNVHIYSDRHLLSIQKTAIALANGGRIFVSSKMKPMVAFIVNEVL